MSTSSLINCDEDVIDLSEAAEITKSNQTVEQHAQSQMLIDQAFVLSNNVLPIKAVDLAPEKARNLLEHWGFVFEGNHSTNKAFALVKMPADWTKQPLDEFRTAILDLLGRQRLIILHENINNPTLEFKTRFEVRMEAVEENEKTKGIFFVIYDSGKVATSLDPVVLPEESSERGMVVGQAKNQAWTWLDMNYPYWRNLSACWD